MISAVIATHNDAERLVATLTALVPAAAEGLVGELVVVDGGSQDATEQVVDAAGGQWLVAAGTLAQRQYRGAQVARGPWLLVLSPGAVLDAHWLRDTEYFLKRAVPPSGKPLSALFRYGVDGYGWRPPVREAAARLRLLCGFGPHADQPLLIDKNQFLQASASGTRTSAQIARRLGGSVRLLRSQAVMSEPSER